VHDAYVRGLDALGPDYVDLQLIHWANPKHDR
jgi:diketogulonate reductase-like aldo/keto reductase